MYKSISLAPAPTELVEREEQAEFLAASTTLVLEANGIAADVLGEEETLTAISRLALPYRGVWSILDVYEGDTARRIPVSHPTPRLQALARELPESWPPSPDLARGGTRALRAGDSEVIPEVTDDMLSGLADSADHLRLLRELRIGSVLTVALGAEAGTLGLLTFIGPRWGHRFEERDRRLAAEIAASATLAISNSRRAAMEDRTRATQETEDRRLSFMTSLSHTFRTPLHNIYGYAQLLAAGIGGPLTGEQRHDVERIQANERHLLSLVEAVISFARWDVTGPVSLEDVSVCDAVRRTNAVITRAAANKGVLYDPEVIISEDVIVRAEPIRLHEILLQLMLNAVQFSRPGDSVSVCAVPVGDRIWIRVADTGIGIAKSDLALIFQPFTRAREQLEQAREGVGLGLTITQTLARAMGGELSVVSVEGRGSTFTLSLPRGRDPSQASCQPNRAEAPIAPQRRLDGIP